MTTKTLALSAALLSLAACGGGGGGSSSGNGNGVTTSAPADLSAITAIESEQVAQASFSGMTLLLQATYNLFLPNEWLNRTNASPGNNPLPCNSGSFNLNWVTSNNVLDSGDKVNLTFNNCYLSIIGQTLDGSINLSVVDHTETGGDEMTDGLVSADMDITENTTTRRVTTDGAFTYSYDDATGDETTTYDGDATIDEDVSNNESAELEDFLGSYVYLGTGDEIYDGSYTGTNYIGSIGSSVEVTTISPFTILSADDYPSTGEMDIESGGATINLLDLPSNGGDHTPVQVDGPNSAATTDSWDNYYLGE